MQRGRFLVNMVEERDKENIAPPITFTQHATVEDNLKMSSSDEVSSKETHAVLTPVNTSIPSTSIQQNSVAPNYYISPIRSDESDIDDSDEDPNFQLLNKNELPPKVVPSSSSVTSSSTSSSSSSSSDTEDDSKQVGPENVMVPESGIEIEKRAKREYAN